MATQKALVVREIGKPLVLVHDRRIPEPASGQVQIKVAVTGLNPHDQRSRDTGLLIADNLPNVLGKDVVGTVSKLGPDVSDFAVGDRIVSLGSHASDSSQSGLQEYAVADVVNSCRIPPGLSDSEAATLPTNVSAAFVSLFITLGLPAPWADSSSSSSADRVRKLLIVGGGSNCGKYAVQLARLAHIPEIVVVGGPAAELTALGATAVVDRHGEPAAVLAAVRNAVGADDDLLHALDAVNLPQGLGLALDALSSRGGGKLARLVPLGTVQDTRGHEVLDVFGSRFYGDPLCVALWGRLAEYVRSGAIRPVAHSSRHGLDADVVNTALDELRDGGRKGGQLLIHI
ncbi:putative alcohol dehydrogenase [Xylariaceae sp. FL0804]|nr:putative alcohol dehydrogenase [Xylariaceae sp. FL0804]